MSSRTIKTGTWIIIFAVIVAVSLGAAVFIRLIMKDRRTAVITVDGKVVRRIDLDAPYGDYTFTIKTPEGYNTVQVSDGKIRMIDADCRDRICVDHGWLEDNTLPIVCLPHKVVISFEEGS